MEKIKKSTYVHDPKPKVEWKAKFISWTLNKDMDIESPFSMEKKKKTISNTSGTTDMEEGLIDKWARTQGLEHQQEREEEEQCIHIQEQVSDNLGFQVSLEIPLET